DLRVSPRSQGRSPQSRQKGAAREVTSKRAKYRKCQLSRQMTPYWLTRAYRRKLSTGRVSHSKRGAPLILRSAAASSDWWNRSVPALPISLIAVGSSFCPVFPRLL